MTTPKYTQATYSIDYEEGKVETYRGIEVTFDNERAQRYGAGDLIIDWYEMQRDFVSFGISTIKYAPSVYRFFQDDHSRKYHLLFFDNKLELVEDLTEYRVALVSERWMTCYKEIKEYRQKNMKYGNLISSLDSLIHNLGNKPSNKKNQ